MNADVIDSDEVFARFLQEQEKLEAESVLNADLELARQLANEEKECQEIPNPSSSSSKAHNNYIQGPSSSKGNSIQDPSSSKSIHYYLTAESQQFNRDLELARQLEIAERDNYQSSLSLIQQWTQREQHDDYMLAKKLEHKVDDSILEEELPNLHELFLYFNAKYFSNRLNAVEVKWSHKMTRCAGTCAFKPGGYCVVTLSEPLLKFRSKKDYFETLLHEMIHALNFIENKSTDRDGHGPEFLIEAARIGKASGFTITVFHNFHDEVKHYQTHVWKCDGPCKDLPPYYGICKRSMNRPPQKADSWFADHQRNCGGTFHKISSPPPKETSKKRKKTPSNTLDNYFDDVDQKMKKLKEF